MSTNVQVHKYTFLQNWLKGMGSDQNHLPRLSGRMHIQCTLISMCIQWEHSNEHSINKRKSTAESVNE